MASGIRFQARPHLLDVIGQAPDGSPEPTLSPASLQPWHDQHGEHDKHRHHDPLSTVIPGG
jgi:hypothetical protein